jgi:hypothetical protein
MVEFNSIQSYSARQSNPSFGSSKTESAKEKKQKPSVQSEEADSFTKQCDESDKTQVEEYKQNRMKDIFTRLGIIKPEHDLDSLGYEHTHPSLLLGLNGGSLGPVKVTKNMLKENGGKAGPVKYTDDELMDNSAVLIAKQDK